jgi:hypothetical protein
MITCIPITITESMITDSSVAYPGAGETAWNSGTTYAAGDTVSYLISGFYHRFESKAGTNLNHIPEAYPDDSANAWWLDLGYVNRMAAFQLERNTQTITASPYTVSIDPGERFGVVGIGNIDADDVQIDVYDGATLEHTETKTLLSRDVYDWYTWTFAPFDQIKSTVLLDLPIKSTNTIDLTFTRSSGDVGVGAIVVGMPINIGRALVGTGIRRLNFSLFERDEFGESKVTTRRNIPRVDFSLIIDKDRLNGIIRLIDQLNGVVTMWSGIVEVDHGYFESVFLIGLYKDFGYTLDYPRHAKGDIQIEAI